MNYKLIKNVAVDILTNIPYRPFFCLPLSATLYAVLNDNHGIKAKLITGNLTYNNNYIFKQDFSIKGEQGRKLTDWSGHAWVEVEDYICDLSFFRSLYSEKFTKPYKSELIALFGEGRGLLIARACDLQQYRLSYHAIDTLHDNIATGIIRGIEHLI